jgi:hypothetical protein
VSALSHDQLSARRARITRQDAALRRQQREINWLKREMLKRR